jgi:hypothetical protein
MNGYLRLISYQQRRAERPIKIADPEQHGPASLSSGPGRLISLIYGLKGPR